MFTWRRGGEGSPCSKHARFELLRIRGQLHTRAQLQLVLQAVRHRRELCTVGAGGRTGVGSLSTGSGHGELRRLAAPCLLPWPRLLRAILPASEIDADIIQQVPERGDVMRRVMDARRAKREEIERGACVRLGAVATQCVGQRLGRD